jgi:8-oxo-dGTP diphosphatase
MSQPIGCVVLVIKENKILLGKRKNGYGAGMYGVPGGRVEVGEKLEVCARRELVEETGPVGKDIQYVGVIKESQGSYDFVHFVFKCQEFSGEPTNVEPNKCENWEWYELNHLPTNILPGHFQAINMLIANQSLRDI